MKIKMVIKVNNLAAIQLAESAGFKLSAAESMPLIYRKYLTSINCLQYEQYT